MSKRVGVILISIWTLGCLPTFKNPLDQPVGSEVNEDQYLGDWDLVRVGNRISNDSIVATIARNSQGETFVRIASPSEGKLLYTVKTTRVNSEDMFSATEVGGGGWQIGKAERTQSGNTLNIYLTNVSQVREDIENENILGTISEILDHEVVEVEETGPGIRDYLSSTPEVFDATPHFVLERKVP